MKTFVTLTVTFFASATVSIALLVSAPAYSADNESGSAEVTADMLCNTLPSYQIESCESSIAGHGYGDLSSCEASARAKQAKVSSASDNYFNWLLAYSNGINECLFDHMNY